MKFAPISNAPGEYVFDCPGCGEMHCVRTAAASGANWRFNGNLDKPTISPSLLVRSGHYIPSDKKTCWCTYKKEHPEKEDVPSCYICHSFIKDGYIQFLPDCTHTLAGQTVEIPDFNSPATYE